MYKGEDQASSGSPPAPADQNPSGAFSILEDYAASTNGTNFNSVRLRWTTRDGDVGELCFEVDPNLSIFASRNDFASSTTLATFVERDIFLMDVANVQSQLNGLSGPMDGLASAFFCKAGFDMPTDDEYPGESDTKANV